jgi:hypothetical protein
MTKLTMASIKKVAKKYNAIIDCILEPYGHRDMYIEAPDGYVWVCSSTHDIRFPILAGERWKKDRQESFQDAIKRMEMGVEKCTDSDCGICNQE